MKLSSHDEYGLRCLLQVARQGADGSATIPEISRREGISPAYVGKLMRILRQGGFVKSARGKAGGYTLALPPERIRVGDALTVLGGRIYEDDFCRRHSGCEATCPHSTDCSIRSLWRSLQGAIDSVLRTMTIRDLFLPESQVLTNFQNIDNVAVKRRSRIRASGPRAISRP
jgi:Rrf2 family protein